MTTQTVDAAEIAALVDRCEAASEPSVALFREAYVAVFGPKPERVHGGSAEMTSYLARFNPFYVLITHYGWLDAAITLLPEGWKPRQMNFSAPCADDRKWHLNLHGGNVGHDLIVGRGATPALALTAAALRAHLLQQGRSA